jgi:hypothetical protein
MHHRFRIITFTDLPVALGFCGIFPSESLLCRPIYLLARLVSFVGQHQLYLDLETYRFAIFQPS